MKLDEAGLESMMQWTRLSLDVRETVIVQGCLAQAVAEIRRQRAVIAELAELATRDHRVACPALGAGVIADDVCACLASAHNARVRELAGE